MRILWISALIGFATLNVYALAAGGVAEFFAYLGRLGPWGIVATADLLLALLIGITWMWRDGRTRGISTAPFIALTLATGSLGLLLYLAVHGGRQHVKITT